MKLTKEATYVFKFNDEVKEVDVYVDNVETRRYLDKDPFDQNSYLNYKGTGKPYQKINAEIVSESLDNSNPSYPVVRLMYLLPDVNAYVVGDFSGVVDEEGVEYKYLSVKFLNKIQ